MPRNLEGLYDLVTAIQVSTNESAERLNGLGQSIGEQVSEVRLRMVSVEASVRELREDMAGHSGSAPLPVRMALVERSLDAIEDRMASKEAAAQDDQKEQRRLKITVIGIGVAAAVAILAQIVAWVLRGVQP